MDIKLSKIFYHIPSDEEILYLKQFNIGYVHVWVPKKDFNDTNIKILKNRLNKHNITLYMVGCIDFCKDEKFVVILGDNIFFTNVLIVGTFKIVTMALCFCYSPIIAPIGLIFIYIMNTIQERKSIQS